MSSSMAMKVHEASSEGMQSALELFTVPPTNLQVERSWSQEYFPIAPLVNSQQVQFNVTSSSEHYIDLNKTLIEIHCKIVTSTGANTVKETDKVTPMPNFLHTLFSQVSVHMNGNLVSRNHNLYGYMVYMQTLLNNRQSVQDEQYDTALFLKDFRGNHDEQDSATNKNAAFRRLLFEDSRKHDMIGKLHGDIFNFDRYLLNNIDLQLTLTRAKDAFCLFSLKPNASYKVEITKAILHVTHIKVSPPLILAHNAMLQKTTAKYPIMPVDMKTFSFPSGLSHISIDNLILGQIPKRLVIGMVKSVNFIGDYTKNPYRFEHFKLNYLCLTLNGEQIPAIPYTPDFENKRYSRVYHDFLDTICVWDRDRTCGIEWSDYSEGYTLYAFDLSADKCGGETHYNLMKNGTVRLECKFAAALVDAVHIVCLIEYENLMEIDSNRTIAFDYSI